MKNLIEELQKLNNEEEYNVPSDFRKKVMDKIDNDTSNVVKFKYVMPLLSSVAIIMIGIVLIGKNGSLERAVADNKTMMIAESSMQEAFDEGKYINDYAATNGMNVFDSLVSADKAHIEETEIGLTTTEKNYLKSEFYAEIANMFEMNDVQATVSGNSVKAKCSKTKAEEILFYYEGQITITIDGEYVIVE